MAKKSPKPSTYLLPECLDMMALEPLSIALLERAERVELVLDLSAVQRLSTAAVQLLLACARTMEAQEKACLFQAPSPLAQQVFSQLGLSNELEIRSGQ